LGSLGSGSVFKILIRIQELCENRPGWESLPDGGDELAAGEAAVVEAEQQAPRVRGNLYPGHQHIF